MHVIIYALLHVLIVATFPCAPSSGETISKLTRSVVYFSEKEAGFPPVPLHDILLNYFLEIPNLFTFSSIANMKQTKNSKNYLCCLLIFPRHFCHKLYYVHMFPPSEWIDFEVRCSQKYPTLPMNRILLFKKIYESVSHTSYSMNTLIGSNRIFKFHHINCKMRDEKKSIMR